MSIDCRSLIRRMLEHLADASPTEEGQPGRLVQFASVDPICDAYITALIDLLAFLGAVTAGNTPLTVLVPTIQSGYFLRMLSALLDSQAPLVADWTHEGVARDSAHPFATAVDLLAALERRRLELSPDAVPLRTTRAAIGLIFRRSASGAREYLLVWDAPAGMWQLIGGRFEWADETLRATMLRELVEELNCNCLVEGVDVTLDELGLPFVEDRLSPTYGLLSRTIFQSYIVRFVAGLPAMHTALRWTSEAELQAGTTLDGQPISTAPLLRLLAQPNINLDAFLPE